jgi:hypothetical protein
MIPVILAPTRWHCFFPENYTRLVAQQQTDQDILSTADKNEIVASALRSAFGTSGHIRPALSTENLEFVDSTRMSEMGFTLVGAGQVQFFLDDYVVFQRIAANDGVVSVVLSRTTLSRACFSRTVVSTERRTFTFEFHKEASEWIGQRVDQLMLQVQRSNKLFAKP